MTDNPWPPSPVRRGTLHQYSGQLTTFIHDRPGSDSTKIKNLFLFIGGLCDGLCTVPYPTYLAQTLPASWHLGEVMLRSSYEQFGFATLTQDADDLEQCVNYFRQKISVEKIVIMGHSTGSQDVMEYLSGGRNASRSRSQVDGAIIQGSVSDREAFFQSGIDDDTYNKLIALCRQMKAEGKEQDVVPDSFVSTLFDPTPITAYRWLSLLSPDKSSDDDFFSSDLTDAQLKASFGSLPEKLSFLILYGEADPYVPEHVDRKALVSRWTSFAKAAGVKVDDINGGAIPDMTHNLKGVPEEVVRDMCERICRFLANV